MLALVLSLALSLSAFAKDGKNNAPLNQSDTHVLAHKANDIGSDESLKNSTMYMMQALIDLGNTKLPSAMSNGYQAYGKFRNAENLDYLKDQNAAAANSLASVGNGPVIKGPAKTQTTFRRLDPAFLREGQYAKVASEFERQTGMARGEFLKEVATISEKKISRSDPMMIDKALSRFEGFLAKIPNAEFRKKAEANIAKVPSTMRRGIVAQAVSKLTNFFADAGPAAKVPAMGTPPVASLAGTKSTGNDSPVPEETSPVVNNERKPAALGATSEPVGDAGGGAFGTGYGNVVEAAIETQGQDSPAAGELTLFQQVTKRYRSLTPSLVKSTP